MAEEIRKGLKTAPTQVVLIGKSKKPRREPASLTDWQSMIETRVTGVEERPYIDYNGYERKHKELDQHNWWLLWLLAGGPNDGTAPEPFPVGGGPGDPGDPDGFTLVLGNYRLRYVDSTNILVIDKKIGGTWTQRRVIAT